MRKNLLFCLLCILCSVNMYAEEWTDENGVTWSFSITTIEGTTGASLNGMTGNTKDVVIPEEVYSGETPYPVIYLEYNDNLFGDEPI